MRTRGRAPYRTAKTTVRKRAGRKLRSEKGGPRTTVRKERCGFGCARDARPISLFPDSYGLWTDSFSPASPELKGIELFSIFGPSLRPSRARDRTARGAGGGAGAAS